MAKKSKKRMKDWSQEEEYPCEQEKIMARTIEASIIEADNRNHKSFAAMFASPVINIIVGPAKKEYHLHEGVLVRKTPYFASLLRSGLREAQNRSVELSTEVDREDAFEKYIEYLYQDDYSVPEDIEIACIMHARVHTLAERLCVDKLKRLSSQKLQDSLSKGYEEVSLFGYSDSRSGRKPRISAATLITLASIIYTQTPDIPQESERNMNEIELVAKSKPHSLESFQLESGFLASSSDGGNSRADCRHIVSCFAASCWSRFRLDENLRRFMDGHTDFAYDVLFRASDGEQLRSS